MKILKWTVGLLAAALRLTAAGRSFVRWEPENPEMTGGSNIVLDEVCIHVKAESKESFFAEKFTVEDLQWDNAERLSYSVWFENTDPQYGLITVHLKQGGREKVYAAIEHFETLYFVEKARPYAIFEIQ